MKRLFTILLTLALLVSGISVLAEDAPLRIGYIAPIDEEGGRHSLCADAFAYAAAQKGVSLTALRYAPAEVSEDSEFLDPAVMALNELIEEGVDGVAVVPASMEQAVELIERANEAGVPILIEGMDVSPAYPSESEEEEPAEEETAERPYVAAVGYGDGAAYAATLWLEEYADNPLMFHCALPTGDLAIQAGIARALGDARYLDMADELNAASNTPAAGSEAINLLISSFTMFYCVLADSEELAQGCADGLRRAGDSMPIAAISGTPEALELLKRGTIDMLAATPASVEGVQCFKLLFDYLTDGALPETETGFVALPVIVATTENLSDWIDGDDCESAYALAYPEPEEEAAAE